MIDDDVDETLILEGGIFAFIKDSRKVTFSEVTLHMELKDNCPLCSVKY
jgi:hypothetical protein